MNKKSLNLNEILAGKVVKKIITDSFNVIIHFDDGSHITFHANGPEGVRLECIISYLKKERFEL